MNSNNLINKLPSALIIEIISYLNYVDCNDNAAAKFLSIYNKVDIEKIKLHWRKFTKFETSNSFIGIGLSIIFHYANKTIHNENGPAVIWNTGRIEYWIRGKIHREDAPAVIDGDNSVEYYKYGRIHNDDGPAIIRADGTLEYWINGERQN
jgi:hypothetical protein